MLPEALTRLLAVPRNLPWQPLPHAHRQRVDVTDDFNWRPSVAKLRLLQRSGFRCAGCGLVSAPSTEVPSGYLELVAAEDCRAALCVLCSQALHVGRVVRDRTARDHGVIVYCPSLTQGQVCQLFRDQGVARVLGLPGADALADRIDRLSLEGSELARQALGLPAREFADGMTIPLFLEVLDAMPTEVDRDGLLRDLRYLPRQHFNKQLEYWAHHSPGYAAEAA